MLTSLSNYSFAKPPTGLSALPGPAPCLQAGDPYARGAQKGQGRRLLQFELRPRPSATIDFRQQLAAAGHQVPSK